MKSSYKKILIFIGYFAVFSAISVHASFEFKSGGARGAALAGACTAVTDDAESIWWNPAGMRFCEGIQINSLYTNLYGLSDLNYLNFSFILPTISAGTWGLGYSSFGPDSYREKDIRLGFATELSRGFYFGTNLKNESLQIGNEGGKAGAFGVDVGVTTNVSEQLSMAAVAVNVNNPTLGDTSETLARRFNFGLQLKPNEKWNVSFDLQKPLNDNMELRCGVESMLSRSVIVRCGAQTRPSKFTFGFGLNMSIFSFNYAILTHRVLSAQHMFSLTVGFRPQTGKKVIYEEETEIKQKISGKVNINTADIKELLSLPGIGKMQAKEIIDYREKTGKFGSIMDLMNIYGFPRSRYDKIKDYVTVTDGVQKLTIEEIKPELESEPESIPEFVPDPEPEPVPEFVPDPEPVPEFVPEPEETDTPGKMRINNINLNELKSLPGISPALAAKIIQHRKRRGKFRNWNELLKIPGMNRNVLGVIKKNCEMK